MPKKLKLWIVGLLQVALIWMKVATIFEISTLVINWSHASAIRWALWGLLLLVFGGFAWRFYTGMIRDRDYYVEE